jgi:hypothetical protein
LSSKLSLDLAAQYQNIVRYNFVSNFL